MQEFDDYKKYIFVGGDNGRKAVSSNRNGK